MSEATEDDGNCIESVANDVCDGAFLLDCGETTEGSTTCATPDGQTWCGDDVEGTAFSSNGVWYFVEGTGDLMTLSTCNIATNFDTHISVYMGACGDLSCEEGNNDASDGSCEEGSATASEVTFSSMSGEGYYVLVTGTDDTSGDFGLSLTCSFGGCTDEMACNYDMDADYDNDTCEYETCAGCTDEGACNYDMEAIIDNDTCEYETCAGCMNEEASNYDPEATIDDGSCTYCELVITEVEVTNVSCFGGSDGMIVVTVEGATSEAVLYGLEGETPTTDPVVLVDGLAGEYTIVVYDGEDCLAMTNVIVTQPDAELTLDGVATNPLCWGEAGSVELQADGGTGLYSYSLDCENFMDEPIFPELEVGTYEVCVLDSNGCMASWSFDITQPDEIVITLDGMGDEGADGTLGWIDVSVSGGTGEYEYTWELLGSFENWVTEDIEDLLTGTYVLSVLDENGCWVVSEEFLVDYDSVEELGEAWSFEVYPNPSAGQFLLETSQQLTASVLSIYDGAGRVVWSDERAVLQGSQAIVVNELASGLYTIRVTSNVYSVVKQLFIQR
jgi:hypothetical protein